MPNITRRAEIAHQRREEIIKLKSQVGLVASTFYWEIAKKFYEIWQNKDWKNLGFDSWSAYLAAPVNSGGLDISRTWAVKAKENYQKYVIELSVSCEHLALASPEKLYEVKDKVKKDNVEKWLEKVREISRSDLKLEKKEVEQMECKHERIKPYWKCLDCEAIFSVDPRKK